MNDHLRRAAHAILFDLDDTLYPRARFVRSGLDVVARHAAAVLGLDLADTRAVLAHARRQRPGRELQALCAHARLDPVVIPEFVAVFRSHRPRLRLPAAARRMLADLRSDGWRIAIVTNGDPAVQRSKIAALGLDALVDQVICADEYGGKPRPAPFRAAMDRLGVSARRCVMVGDDPHADVAGAAALGLATIGIRRATAVHEMGGADVCVDTLDAIRTAAATLLDLPVFESPVRPHEVFVDVA